MKYVVKKLENTLSITGIVNLHFFEFTSGFVTKREGHPFYELVFVNSGALEINSDDYTGTLKKNQMIIHRENAEHSLHAPSGDSPSVIIIGFECDSDLIDEFSYQPTELSSYAVRKLAEIVKEGRNVFKPPYDIPVYDMKKKKSQKVGSEQILKILLEYFLIKLLRDHGGADASEDTKEPPSLIQEIVQYAEDNYLERITIDELAFLFKTNRATLCKEFKRYTGLTVVEFINRKKFERAKEKITASSGTFTEIAASLNFDSIHYFTRFFKKMSGMTPGEYRTHIKRNGTVK